MGDLKHDLIIAKEKGIHPPQNWTHRAIEEINVRDKAIKDLLAALKTFVDRVEEGSISSKKTYAQFKELIEKYGVNSNE